jgi:hypothetical protein
MYQLFLKTSFAFLLIPLLTLALEPTNPSGLCDRFLGDKEKAQCMQKTTKEELDWYAASACSLQQEDRNFMGCLDEIKGASFNPEALELCAKTPEISDDTRLSCIKKVKGKDYTRTQLKKCSEAGDAAAVEGCLSTNSRLRSPASATNPQGFQSLEIRK